MHTRRVHRQPLLWHRRRVSRCPEFLPTTPMTSPCVTGSGHAISLYVYRLARRDAIVRRGFSYYAPDPLARGIPCAHPTPASLNELVADFFYNRPDRRINRSNFTGRRRRSAQTTSRFTGTERERERERERECLRLAQRPIICYPGAADPRPRLFILDAPAWRQLPCS
jgi:hypothetical protein